MRTRTRGAQLFRGFLAKLRGRQRGQSFVIVAFAMIGLLGFIGFAVDTGSLYLHRIWLGQAVDAAALAAGYELPNIKASCARAVDYLRVNDFTAGTDFSYQIIFTSEPDAPGGDPGEFIIDSVADNIATPDDCATVTVPASHEDVHYHLRVKGDQQVPVILMGLFGFDTVGVALPGTAVRTARYDVALVLDKSGSMKFDTCVWYRPDDEYACQNRYTGCTDYFTEDFNSYATTADLQDSDWTINEGVTITTSGRSGKGIRLTKSGGDYGIIERGFDTTGLQNVALSFWAKNETFTDKEKLEVYWRPDSGAGWSITFRFNGDDLTSDWLQYSVLLPSGAWDNPDLAIRIRGKGTPSKTVLVDDIALMTCVETLGPWSWYHSSYSDGCRPDRPMTCDDEAPQTMIPAVPPSNNKPEAHLMQQPMFDVIVAADTFIDILDSRRLPAQPRTDMIGLAVYNKYADPLVTLTTDYESIKDSLYSQISAGGWTNIGGGIRVGLDLLSDARANSVHYIILLTDGWPNHWDSPYVNPSTFGNMCGGGGVCQETLEYIDAQVGQAQAQNVTIFTIGLGQDLETETFDASSAYGAGTENFSGMDLLERISTATAGTAYHAPTSEELQQIFQWIAEAIFVRLTY